MACFVAVLAALPLPLAAGVVPIATFDGAVGTTWPWETVNDPVMGGRSNSTFQVDTGRKVGIWDGEVRIVPFLRAPGFCNLQAPGLYKAATFPDLSSADGIVIRARETSSSGLTHFNVMLTTKGARRLFKQGVYVANFSMSGSMQDHFLPWKAFACSWRGDSVSWCPVLTTQLGQVTNVGVGTAYPGPARKFHVELASLSAGPGVTLGGHAQPVDLATFDGSATHEWKTENDPVMGGRSDSNFVVKNGYGEYSGTCRIVPSLQAPGFTIALTESPLVGRFPDVSSADGIILGLRNLDPNITSFKFAFCDSHINLFRCQFATFKADFELAPSSGFGNVFLPWSKFSDKWSASTGKHTAENPPTAASLRSITQLQIWTEGVAGHFQLQIKSVRAGRAVHAQTTHFV
eukprot:CAMPEP_0171108640 /NCGR_PEP_ID=MMETSP0766_2-20121228/69338_1 /TAXON_ID=439317 /ORGANISM="Gambierdiscus australes, Strain CAWD 149" /LENGTH=403 /DNA_ID=CAMNT_0011570217 /DNA_START=61 /DNA_END=1272 /DNA_ORIENTATION=-